MSDIALSILSSELGDTFDASISRGDLTPDEGLRTAVIISLFTDARAEKDELLYGQSQRGWWFDALNDDNSGPWGSRLWLLEREKQTLETLTRATEYAKAALQWMITDEIVRKVDVVASYPLNGFLFISVKLTKPNGEELNYDFDKEWKTEEAR